MRTESRNSEPSSPESSSIAASGGAAIQIRKASENNLQGIDCDIPRGRLTAVCGPSGSGKSSLVFDTILRAAECRALSALGRHGALVPPRVDLIRALSFCAGLRRKLPRARRATVGSVSDATAKLKSLFLEIGEETCPKCQAEIAYDSPSSIIDRALRMEGSVGVFARMPISERERLLSQGFTRALISGVLIPLESAEDDPLLLGVDVVSAESPVRLSEAIRLGLELGSGAVLLRNASGELEQVSAVPRCVGCGAVYAPVEREIGSVMNERMRSFRMADLSLGEILARPIESLVPWLEALQVEGDRARRSSEELRGIVERICRLDLGYLSLDRSVATLSSGEAQRVLLARFLGSAMHGVSYLLDEPTTGLHPRDIQALLGELRRLVEQGNTAILVEHNVAAIKEADFVLELGPGGGSAGGRIVSSGGAAVVKDVCSRMSARPLPLRPEAAARGVIGITDVSKHNLKNLSVEIPLGVLVAVCGVSGSGKSTLIREVLVPALVERRLGVETKGVSAPDLLRHVYDLGEVLRSTSHRSTVLSRIGIEPELRRLYARTPAAKVLGLVPGDFSPKNERVHDITFRGVRFGGIGELSIREALDTFGRIPRVAGALRNAVQLGLEYLHLGERTRAISLGEFQRLVLSRFLARGGEGMRLFVLDEPSQGLHPEEEDKLIGVLYSLVRRGDTVIVIDHSPRLIRAAHHIIELGPEGGSRGGEIVAQGTLAEILRTEESRVAPFLRDG